MTADDSATGAWEDHTVGHPHRAIAPQAVSAIGADRAQADSALWFTSFGLRIAVQSDNPGALAQLASRPPTAWRATVPKHAAVTKHADRRYSLGWDCEAACHVLAAGTLVVDRASTLDDLLDSLEIDGRHFVAEFARRRVFVHAGTVAVNGRAVVIPGRSGTGKSTLVAALVRRGAAYYSDEYAVFDDRGRVHPYPKPLTLWADDGSPAASGPDHLSSHRRPPLPLGAILDGRFAGPGTTWHPRIELASHGVMRLLDNTIALRRQPAMTLTFLQRAVSDVIVLMGERGDADQTADAVIGLIERAWK